MSSKIFHKLLSLSLISSVIILGFSLSMHILTPLLLAIDSPFLPVSADLTSRNNYMFLLFSLELFTLAIGAQFFGSIADKSSHRRAFLISTMGLGASYLLSSSVYIFPNIFFLLLARTISGFFAGGLALTVSAITRFTPFEKKRSLYLGFLFFTWSLGWEIAPYITQFLIPLQGAKFTIPMLIYLCFSVVFFSFYYVFRTLPPNTAKAFKTPLSLSETFVKKKSLFYIGLIFLWTFSWGLAGQWFGTYSMIEYQASPKSIFSKLLMQEFFWIFGALILNPLLLKKYNCHFLACFGFLSTAIAFYLLPIIKTFFNFWLIYCGANITSSIAFINLISLFSITQNKHQQGKLMSFSLGAKALSWLLVPVIGGQIAWINHKFFYPISASILLLGFLILIWKKLKDTLTSKHVPHTKKSA